MMPIEKPGIFSPEWDSEDRYKLFFWSLACLFSLGVWIAILMLIFWAI